MVSHRGWLGIDRCRRRVVGMTHAQLTILLPTQSDSLYIYEDKSSGVIEHLHTLTQKPGGSVRMY